MKIELFGSDKLNFVELNITGDNDNYESIDSESKFLESEVFNIFISCFENSNKLFDYFGPTKYNSRKIIVLRNQLIENFETLKAIETIDHFMAFIDGIFLGNNFILSLENLDKNWKSNWKIYVGKLIKVNAALIELVDLCVEQDRILWVKGY
jgi:hypothetical protein